jgi:hypothetical protein
MVMTMQIIMVLTSFAFVCQNFEEVRTRCTVCEVFDGVWYDPFQQEVWRRGKGILYWEGKWEEADEVSETPLKEIEERWNFILEHGADEEATDNAPLREDGVRWAVIPEHGIDEDGLMVDNAPLREDAVGGASLDWM